MATQNLPQSLNTSNTPAEAFTRAFCQPPPPRRLNFLTRRRFLTGLVGLIPLGASLGAGPAKANAAPIAPTPGNVHRRQILEVAQTLTRLYLLASSDQPDGIQLLDLECQAAGAMEALIAEIDNGEANEALYLAATGRSKSYWTLKASIEDGEQREIVQREIDAFIAAGEPAFAELQTLLDGGVS